MKEFRKKKYVVYSIHTNFCFSEPEFNILKKMFPKHLYLMLKSKCQQNKIFPSFNINCD